MLNVLLCLALGGKRNIVTSSRILAPCRMSLSANGTSTEDFRAALRLDSRATCVPQAKRITPSFALGKKPVRFGAGKIGGCNTQERKSICMPLRLLTLFV